MNRTKTVLAIALMAAAALPMNGHATESKALDRCVEIFIKEVVPADRAVEIRRDDILASMTKLPLDRKAVTLIARGSKEGELIGRATCTVRRAGSRASVRIHEPRSSLAGAVKSRVDIEAG